MIDHDTDVWELVTGDWIWSCRTCLDKGISPGEEIAATARDAHLRRPVPWWAARPDTTPEES